MFKIAERLIGAGRPPFIIAEMSGNHNQSLDRALAIVDAAAAAGAHAIKLQTYTADTLTIDMQGEGFTIADGESLWQGRNLYDLYREAYTPWEWHAPIFGRARAKGLVAFSSPFDELAVDFLETLDVPAYKIASFENVHLPLIRKAAATGKPLVISTGMATKAELDDAVAAAREMGCRDLVLLKCTSTYPATPENTNLATIADLRARYGCEVGPVGSHDGSGCGGRRSRAGRDGDREAFHAWRGPMAAWIRPSRWSRANSRRSSRKQRGRLPRWARSGTARPTPSESR